MISGRKNCLDLQVLDVRPFCDDPARAACFELVLEGPDWEGWSPGQFVMLRPVDWGLDLVWGRPFSIAGADGQTLRIFFQVVGRGTQRLARLRPGDAVTVWGPLGNSFAMEPHRATLLLAGGIGLAPFMGYARRHPHPENVELLFGHRLPQSCYPMEKFFRLHKAEAMRELRPDDLEAFVERLEDRINAYSDGLVLACGPAPFLRTVRRLALESGARTQLSLENRMACGVGACLGCVTKNAEERFVKVCTEGPVFWAEDLSEQEISA